MKILFVINQIDFADHIALAYLSAIAKERGHSTGICVLKNSGLKEKIDEFKPDVLAYSANVLGFEEIIFNHKLIKHYGIISILGGPQATFSPETFEESGMDAYCIGEGEYAFADFLERVEGGKAFDDVANLITRKNKNAVRPAIKDLDELPMPDRDLTLANTHLKNVPKKTFYATRGCPFKCAYCCNNYYHQLYKGKGPIVRRFSVERLIREIEHVKANYRTDFIKFGDDLFAMRADEWLESFAEQYSSRIGVPFNCYLRIDTIEEGLLKLLKKAGCFSVHLSLDSTSKYVREKVLERHMQSEDIESRIKKINHYGINTWLNYMLAAPESTLKDDLETIRLSKRCRVTYAAYSTTVPMKGTRLYDYCLEHKYIKPQSHKSDMTGCWDKSTLSCFSEKEKNIRYNIYLLGALIAKLPFPLERLAIWIIKIIPPNKLFKRMRQSFYNYNITNKIFKLPKGA